MGQSERLVQQCASEVVEVVPLIMRLLRTEVRRRHGAALSVPQFRALAFLSHCPGASLNGIAEHLGVTPSTASTIADRLVQQGLVERATHPTERRRITLSLTPSGAQLLEQAREAARVRVASVLDGLSDDQLRTVAEGLALLRDAFDREAGARCGDGGGAQT